MRIFASDKAVRDFFDELDRQLQGQPDRTSGKSHMIRAAVRVFAEQLAFEPEAAAGAAESVVDTLLQRGGADAFLATRARLVGKWSYSYDWASTTSTVRELTSYSFHDDFTYAFTSQERTQEGIYLPRPGDAQFKYFAADLFPGDRYEPGSISLQRSGHRYKMNGGPVSFTPTDPSSG